MTDNNREPFAEEPSPGESSAEHTPGNPPEEPTAEAPSSESAAGSAPSDTGKIAAIKESLETEGDQQAGAAAASLDEPPGVESEEQGTEAEPEEQGTEAEPEEGSETVPDTGTVEEAAQGLDASPSEIDMGPERRSQRWVWVGLVIGVLIAAGAIGYAWWYTTSRPVTVPDVVGNVPAQAVQVLNDVDLRFGEMTEEMTDTAPPGTIIGQTPVALATARPGDAVSFVVAAPPDTAQVPDVVGRTAEQAAEDLAKVRLSAYELELYDPNVASGFVVSQLPSAGVELPPGANVALAISRGPAPAEVRVPELVGLNEQDAAALLRSTQLQGAVYRSFDPSITAGEVVGQSPPPGTSSALDGVVQYLVSDGPGERPVTIPDVKGRTEADAKKALEAVPLQVQVRRVSHPSVREGAVISQMPAAGSRTARNAKVGILVSKGSLQRVPAPDLAGKTAEDAEKAASSAGLRWFAVEIATSEHPAGQVFAQYPVAGTEWPMRFPVIGAIAKAP